MTTKLAELDRPDVKKLTTEAGSLAANYEDFAVTNAIGYRDAAEDLKIIKGQLNQVNEKRLEITRPMDAAKKAVMDFFKPVVTRLEDAERHVKRAMVEWKTEEDRIAQEAARKEREKAEREAARLREEARIADEKAAEKERARLAEEQRKADERAAKERERIEAERKAAQEANDAEAERRAKEQAAAQKKREEEEQERLHQERLDAEAAARERSARAATLEDRAETVTTAPVAPGTPKVEGISTRKVWRFEIMDKTKLPAEYLIANEKAIGGVVRALKGDANIPGVRVYSEDVVSARS